MADQDSCVHAVVRSSAVIEAAVDRVWNLLRSFSGLVRWMPGLENCCLLTHDGLDNLVGSVRRLSFAGNKEMHHTLLAYSETDRTYGFKMNESGSWAASPFPAAVYNYFGKLRVCEVTNGGFSFVELSAEFDVPRAAETAVREAFSSSFESTFENLSQYFKAQDSYTAHVKAYTSSIVAAPVDAVWNAIRSFVGISSWMPSIASSVLVERPGSHLVTRYLKLSGDKELNETLLAFSEIDHSYTYNIVEQGVWPNSPFPAAVSNYIATLRCTQITASNNTFVEWSSEFDTTRDSVDLMRAVIEGSVFQAGLDALQARFAQTRRASVIAN
eukprot:gnl/Spiro4/14637_TR7883_c0_g1_i1.p1 gnl/Spiro4/14637_TR7883_c0_g1~~gnl/Spiro4/14637_TR7883_c0_g1_i1.p1  ORF type:complete len:338 (-),score=72.52 gnl/Spiro4/14637_TR7883_c0_g1_i1:17-1000(-)